MSKKRIIPIIVILIVLIAGVTLLRGKKTNTIAVATSNKISIKVSQVDNVAKDPTLSYKASLEEAEVGIVSGKVGGKVVQVMFENGKYVSQGDVLVKLDDQEIKQDIESAEAKLKASESKVKSSEDQLISSQKSLQKTQLNWENEVRTYDRTKVLFDQEVISKVDLEDEEMKLKNAKSDVESAEATVESSRSSIEISKADVTTAQIDLKNLKDSLLDTTITAPISGVMDEKSVNLGQYANIGTTLGKVKKISPIYAVIEVDQNDMGFFKVGQSAKVKVGANNVEEYDGIIKAIEVSADSTSRVFKCKVEVDNQDQSLKPGTYANVDIVGNQKEETLAVSTDALSGTQGNYTVFVNDKGIARKHIVSIGKITNGLVEIEEGLEKGDSVIITNVNTLQDGDTVSVVTE